MVLGYEIITLTEDEKHKRRQLLDFYPFVAQWSVLAVFALFQLSFFASWLARYGLDYERPRSPSFNKRLAGQRAWLIKATRGCHSLQWWSKKDLFGTDWGSRADWILGGLWTLWLLYLSFVDTDYLHLTKRFGAVGASQLPLHYLLAMRAPYSPIQWLTRLSHEQLKASHQILGRIVFLFLTLHATLYLSLFVTSGFLAKRIRDKDVFFGIISIGLFTAISTTALGQLRRWNYRVFYASHVAIANVLVVPLYLHVHHIRPYVWEVFVVNALHLVFREQRLQMYSGTIKLIPGTNLVQIRIPLSTTHAALAWRAGQHVYLSRPTGKPYTASLYDQFLLRNQTNPFTVASIPVKDKELSLVARTMDGTTKRLADLARSLSNGSEDEIHSIPIALEGPYGASVHLPDLFTVDKILLIAGGVGATFIMPIYRSIIETHDAEGAGHKKIRFVWAVQALAETQWAFPEPEGDVEEADSGSRDAGSVEVFVTRGSVANLSGSGDAEEIELGEGVGLLSVEESMKKPRRGMVLRTGRPKMAAVVDEVMSQGSRDSRVAVVACGPGRLTKDLRVAVEAWIEQGHDVLYHEETFGW